MACAKKNPLPLAESMPLEGEKGLTYWCMPAILHSPFSLTNSLFSPCLLLCLILFSFLFLVLTHLVGCDSLFLAYITVPPPLFSCAQ